MRHGHWHVEVFWKALETLAVLHRKLVEASSTARQHVPGVAVRLEWASGRVPILKRNQQGAGMARCRIANPSTVFTATTSAANRVHEPLGKSALEENACTWCGLLVASRELELVCHMRAVLTECYHVQSLPLLW